MSNQYLKLRRSSVPGKIPTTASLDFGEIALNTYDGLAFMKKSGSNGEEVIIIGSTSGSFTGSLFGTASYALTSSYSDNIFGEVYYVAVYTGQNTLFTGSIYDSGSFTGIGAIAPVDPNNTDRLFINAGETDSYNLISGHGSTDNYLQVNVQNFSSGSNASSDIVATNNTGDESSNFINMGINGDGYAVVDGIGQQNDAYLFSLAEDLLIGNAAYGKRVVIFNGTGSAIDVARIFIVPEGTVGINATDANPSNPESLLVEPIEGATNPSQFNNLIIGKGNIGESYIQMNIINLGTGSGASADVVATNDIGTESDYYIDMGINSSNYSTPNAVGMANDAYLYSTGEHLHIGNASAGMPVMIFAGGLDAEANRKLEIWPDDQHYMTGSLEMSGSLKVRIVDQNDALTSLIVVDTATGLLQYTNTASYANIAATASSADDLIIRGNITGSNALFTGTITAQTLHVQYVTASTEFITGSTIFGTQLTDTHQFTGSVSITGSLSVQDLSLNAGLTQFVVVDPATGTLYYNTSGASGTSGTSGQTGTSGTSGIDGSSGTSGASGTSGTSGESGTSGTSGQTGASGTSGTSGTSGESGTSGTSGTSGQTGASGTSGTSGTSGESGTSGTSGSSGTSGQNGSSGTSGTSGTTGTSGTSGIGAFPYTGSAIISGSLEVIGPITASNALFTGTITAQTLNVQYITASTEYITGSTIFGSSLTNTHQFTGSVSITGSLSVNGPLNATSSWAQNSLTASFVTGSNVYGPYGSNSIISASHAVTASYALNAGGAGASNQIVSGSVTASVNINSASFQVTSGSTQLLFVSNSGLVYAQRLLLSSSRNMSSGSTLVVYGSGSSQPVFTIQGSQGELFSVSDSLSGSLFSVNDVSGLPVIEAFSDNRVLIGSYQAPMLTTTVRTTLAIGNNIIYQNIPTASYDAVFFEYSLKSGSNARAGSIMGVWSGSDANYNEVVTADFGDTTGVKFMVMVTGSNIALTGSATTANWTMKTIIRSI